MFLCSSINRSEIINWGNTVWNGIFYSFYSFYSLFNRDCQNIFLHILEILCCPTAVMLYSLLSHGCHALFSAVLRLSCFILCCPMAVMLYSLLSHFLYWTLNRLQIEKSDRRTKSDFFPTINPAEIVNIIASQLDIFLNGTSVPIFQLYTSWKYFSIWKTFNGGFVWNISIVSHIWNVGIFLL